MISIKANTGRRTQISASQYTRYLSPHQAVYRRVSDPAHLNPAYRDTA
jgi:hypothetical protein